MKVARLRSILVSMSLASVWAGAAPADVAEHATVATLPEVGAHWVWVPDRLLEHSLLFDGDSGEVLGMIDSGGDPHTEGAGVRARPLLLRRCRLLARPAR